MKAYFLRILDKSYVVFVSSPEEFKNQLVEAMQKAVREEKTLDTKINYLGQDFYIRDMIKINRRGNSKSTFLYAQVTDGKIDEYWVLDKRNFKFSTKVPAKLENLLIPQQQLYLSVLNVPVGEVMDLEQLQQEIVNKASFFNQLHYLLKSKVLQVVYKIDPALDLDVLSEWTPELPLGLKVKTKETQLEYEIGLRDVLISVIRV